MNDVIIDGVKYVPLSKKPNAFQVNKLSRILAKECPYMARAEVQRVVKIFEKDDEEIQQSKSKKPKKNNNLLFNYGNFKEFDDEGHIIYKRGRGKHPKSSWTIENAINIQQWIKNGKKDSKRVKKLADKYGLTTYIVNQIIYNLKHGSLQLWIDRWLETQNKNNAPKFVQNNKRDEVGWY